MLGSKVKNFYAIVEVVYLLVGDGVANEPNFLSVLGGAEICDETVKHGFVINLVVGKKF